MASNQLESSLAENNPNSFAILDFKDDWFLRFLYILDNVPNVAVSKIIHASGLSPFNVTLSQLGAQWKFSGDKHKSLQVDTERTFHQRYPLVML